MGKRNQGRKSKYGNQKSRIEIKEIKPDDLDLKIKQEEYDFFKIPEEVKKLDKLDLTKTYYAFSKPTFERLLFMKCSLKEICAFYNMREEKLHSEIKANYGKTFEELKKQYDEISKISLRRTLYKLATRYAAVALFLAKNELGMSDNPTTNNLPIINLDTEMNEKESEKVIDEIVENGEPI